MFVCALSVLDGPGLATAVPFSGYVHVWPRAEPKEHGLWRSHRDLNIVSVAYNTES